MFDSGRKRTPAVRGFRDDEINGTHQLIRMPSVFREYQQCCEGGGQPQLLAVRTSLPVPLPDAVPSPPPAPSSSRTGLVDSLHT